MSEIQNIFEVGQGSTAKNKVSLTIRLYLPICPSDYENSKTTSMETVILNTKFSNIDFESKFPDVTGILDWK